MKKGIMLFFLLLLLIGLSACGNKSEQASSLESDSGNSTPTESSVREEAATEKEAESLPADEQRVDEPLIEIDLSNIISGNYVSIDNLNPNEYYVFDTYNDQPIRYIANGGLLEAEVYNSTFDNSRHLLVHDFKTEEILDFYFAGETLFVITDRAAYRFDNEWNIIANIEIPWHLFGTDFKPKFDYFSKSFIINNNLSQMIYKLQDGIYAVALSEGAQPKLIAKHPYVPTGNGDEVKVSKYSPLCFISESKALVSVSGWEWWGLFSVINVDTGEIQQLIDNTGGDILCGSQEAIIFDSPFIENPDSHFYHLDYTTGELKDISFLREYLSIQMARGIFTSFYDTHYFMSYHVIDGGEDLVSFHYADYEAGKVIDLPFSIKAANISNDGIAWVSPNGDILIKYHDIGAVTKYALALAEK